MGTDIHGWIEVKETGGWRSSMTIGLPIRNYRLFSLMAGARCVVEPLIEPRGFPEDCCWYGRETVGEGMDHSISWLTTQELRAVREKLEVESPELNAWIAAMEALEKHYPEVRLVFGFDS